MQSCSLIGHWRRTSTQPTQNPGPVGPGAMERRRQLGTILGPGLAPETFWKLSCLLLRASTSNTVIEHGLDMLFVCEVGVEHPAGQTEHDTHIQSRSGFVQPHRSRWESSTVPPPTSTSLRDRRSSTICRRAAHPQFFLLSLLTIHINKAAIVIRRFQQSGSGQEHCSAIGRNAPPKNRRSPVPGQYRCNLQRVLGLRPANHGTVQGRTWTAIHSAACNDAFCLSHLLRQTWAQQGPAGEVSTFLASCRVVPRQGCRRILPAAIGNSSFETGEAAGKAVYFCPCHRQSSPGSSRMILSNAAPSK
jgi:hypothetical protein